MKLIVVTTPTFFVEEDKIITALFEEGLDILHLRNRKLRPCTLNVTDSYSGEISSPYCHARAFLYERGVQFDGDSSECPQSQGAT